MRPALLCSCALVLFGLLLETVAAQYPSLFRGMVVKQGQTGVIVVSVDPGSPATQSGVQAQDEIVEMGGEPIKSLDQFAQFSLKIRGQRVELPLFVLREKQRVSITVSLYSQPILEHWSERVIPNWDLQFPDRPSAMAYWRKKAREELGQDDLEGTLKALWQLLHYEPDSFAIGLAIADLAALIGRSALIQGEPRQGSEPLALAMRMYRQASARAIQASQLRQIRDHLANLSETLPLH